jgi:hypothetical protein
MASRNGSQVEGSRDVFLRCQPSPPPTNPVVTSLAGFAGGPSPSPRWHGDARCLQVCTCRLPAHIGLLLDAPQGPSETSQRYNLLSFFFAQDVAHADEGYKALCRSQRPGVSLAGFEVTFIGRLCVIAEAEIANVPDVQTHS